MSKTDDLFEQITARVIEAIENGKAGKWEKPWTAAIGASGLGINAQTKAAYQGFNQFVLMVVTADAGYPVNLWATYKQWQALGGQVRKGERGTLLVKWGKTHVCNTCDWKSQKAPCPKDGHARDARIWASAFTVFNAAQQDGYEYEVPELGDEPERFDHVEEFIVATGAAIRHIAGNRAYYNRLSDDITLPLREQFSTPQGYYGTALHELTHWTGADTRLDRTKGAIFGDSAYAAEELVAELGATFLAARFGVETDPHPEHVAYLDSWLKALKADNRALYKAAKAAQDAVSFLFTQSGVETKVGVAA